MAGHKYECKACAITLWVPRKTLCPGCGGVMSLAIVNVPQKASCAICGGEFAPRTCVEKTCSPECSNKLRLQNEAIRSRERYHAMKAQNEQRRMKRGSAAKPWNWLERVVDDSGEIGSRRQLLHTLEDQTRAGAWPWPDVLAGDGPCIMDECPC